MNGVLVDADVILDVVEDDPNWRSWSLSMLESTAEERSICINPVIYSEVSIGFAAIEEWEAVLSGFGFPVIEIPREALFLAGKAYLKYRRQGGGRASPLPDFFIGAHAAVSKMTLLTRDTRRVAHYFPTVELISPKG